MPLSRENTPCAAPPASDASPLATIPGTAEAEDRGDAGASAARSPPRAEQSFPAPKGGQPIVLSGQPTMAPYLRALLSAAPASIKTADGCKLRCARSLPPPRTQCFRCLAFDHLVAACREPVRCRSCLRYGHRSFSCSMAGPFPRSLWMRSTGRSPASGEVWQSCLN